jgi:hypothetical protein
MSRVGNTYRLRVSCLGNVAGVQGVCFYDYGDGFQVIFPNGRYDGFSSTHHMGKEKETEADYFLEKTGLDPLSTDYEFSNVLQVDRDFRAGRWFK